LKALATILTVSLAAASLALSGCSGEKVETSVLLSKSADLGANRDWAGAKKAAKQAVKQSPNDPNALTLLAISLENSGDVDAAVDEINKAAKAGDQSFHANYTKGRLLFQQGKYEQSIAPLKQARALKPESIEALTLLAQAASRQNLSDAAGYWRDLAQTDRFKSRPEPWNEIGVILAKQNDFKRAIKFFVRAESLAPDSPQVAINMAITNDYGLKQPAEAISYYRKYVNLTAKNSELDAKRQQVQERINALSGK